MSCQFLRRSIICFLLSVSQFSVMADENAAAARDESIDVPVVDGSWWKIANDNPNISPRMIVDDRKSNTCDFTVYKDKNGLWHCIACVRLVNHYGERLFFQWTSEKLTDTNWKEVGIFDAPRSEAWDKRPSALQAPHMFTYNGKYYMFYNSNGARALVGDDGAIWKTMVNTDKQETIFKMGRDVMIFHDKDNKRWIAYYCGDYQKKGAMVARTAPEPEGPWSPDEIPVKTDGNPESPFILKRGNAYYLFQQMEVYRSSDPLHFEGRPVAHLTNLWYSGKWAPEVIESGGEQYISGYGDGIWVAKMKWEKKSREEMDRWYTTAYARMEEERKKAEERTQKQ